MKIRLFIRMQTLIAAGVLVALGSAVSTANENPQIFNPVDYSTVPPSSYETSSIRNPINIDLNGNLVITGNVRRGMHFRGTVPYDSTTSFRADLGSSSLSSFLRDSAGIEDLGNPANRYRVQPYYLRSRTVATTRPGYSGVVGPEQTMFNNRRLQGRGTMGTYMPDSVTQTFSGRDTSANEQELSGTKTIYDTPAEPLVIVKSIKELQQLTQKSKPNMSIKEQLLMIERYRKQIQELKDRTLKPEDKSQETDITIVAGPVVSESKQKQSSIENYSSLKMFDPGNTTERARRATPQSVSDKIKSKIPLTDAYDQANAMTFQDGILSKENNLDVQDQGEGLHSDIFRQVKKELEDLIKLVEPTETRDSVNISEDTITNIPLGTGILNRKEGPLFPTESVISGSDQWKRFSLTDLSTRTRDIKSSQTNPETFSVDRFEHHFQEAQEHLKGGRYYAAADSFALASIYKSDEPLCLAGRGHALLAEGEYISSALFLSRTIEADPGYLRNKIDLAVILGGKDILGSRIADIREWLLRSGSGQLDFLLGYIYYRMGSLGPAQQAVYAAYAKMPQSVAVVALKQAVNDALKGK